MTKIPSSHAAAFQIAFVVICAQRIPCKLKGVSVQPVLVSLGTKPFVMSRADSCKKEKTRKTVDAQLMLSDDTTHPISLFIHSSGAMQTGSLVLTSSLFRFSLKSFSLLKVCLTKLMSSLLLSMPALCSLAFGEPTAQLPFQSPSLPGRLSVLF